MRRAHSRTVAIPGPLDALEGEIRGFCTTKEGEEQLKAAGVTRIWRRGHEHESLHHCLITYRGRQGWIVMAEDIRAFGDNKREVAAQCAALEKMNVRIKDLSHPEHETYSEHQQFAHVKISGARLQDKRAAKRVGRLGGVGKGVAAKSRRFAQMGEEYISRIVNHPELTWAIKKELLAGIASISTMRRLFYNRNF